MQCCVSYVVIKQLEMMTRFLAYSFSLLSSEVLTITKYFSRCEGKSERLQVQIKQVQIEWCWKARACLKSETGKLSGRRVSYNTPSCGWVGVELSVGQVDRDRSTTSRWTLAYMQFQAYFHIQASCVNPKKRFARLSMPGLHNLHQEDWTGRPLWRWFLHQCQINRDNL